MIVAREKTGWHQTGADGEKPARQVKRPRKSPKPRLDRWLVTGMVLVFFLTGLLITYYYARLFSLSYQISRLEKELAGLKVENHSLEEEVSRLASLDRVEALAVNKLGMVRPEGGRVLVVTLPENQKGAPGTGVNERTQSPAQAYKSALIEAFDELVNRVEKKAGLSHRTAKAAT